MNSKLVVLLNLVILVLFAGCVSAGLESSGDTAEVPEPQGTEYIVQALEIWEEQRLAEAIGYLEASLDIQPTALGYYFLATRYDIFGTPELAYQALTNAIGLDPSFARAYYERGILLLWTLMTQDQNAAEEDIRTAYRLNPSNPKYGLTLADITRWQKGGESETQEIYNQLIVLLPSDPNPLHSYARWLIDQNEVSQAIELLQKSGELARSQQDFWVLGEIIPDLYRVGLTEYAQELFQELMVVENDNGWLLMSLGTKLVGNGVYHEGLMSLTGAIQTGMDFGDDEHFFLGISELFVNENPEELEMYAQLGENIVYVSIADFGATLVDGTTNEQFARYQVMEEVLKQHWGSIPDKRHHYKWLDDLLIRANR